MTTVARKDTLEEHQPLQAVAASGWLGGFGNLLRKELGQWWGTRTWWVQTLIWVAMLDGIIALMILTDPMAASELVNEVASTFLAMSVGTIAIGTVIAVQGAIVSEKELGTAAWVMSKPASRYAFIMAKVVAYVVGFWFAAMLVPSVLFVIIMGLLVPTPINLPLFLIGVGVVALSQLFYLMLILMLGTFFSSRGPIAAIGIAFVMTGLLLKGMIPMPVLMVTPWLLGDISSGLALGMPLPGSWPVPIIATGIWTALFTVLALWRFNREEF